MENERKKKYLPNNLFVTNVALRSCIRGNYYCVKFKVQCFVLTFRRFLKLNLPKPVVSIWMYLTTSIRKFTSEIIPWEVILLVSHDQLSNVPNRVFLNNMQHCLPWPQRFFLKFFFAKARASRIIISRGTFHAEKKQTRLPECTGSHPKSGERESGRAFKAIYCRENGAPQNLQARKISRTITMRNDKICCRSCLLLIQCFVIRLGLSV